MNMETIQLIRNRGPDFHNTVTINGVTAMSAILSIRGRVGQPIVGENYLLLYNGEIYNGDVSDTMFLKSLIEDAIEAYSEDVSIHGEESRRSIFDMIYKRVNEYENEMAMVLMIGDDIYFFKDDVGRRSLGYTLCPFSVSSAAYDNEIDPMAIYSYNILTKTLHSWSKKDSRLVEEYMARAHLIGRYLNTEKYSHRYRFLDKYRESHDEALELIGKYKETCPNGNDSSFDTAVVNEFSELLKNSLRRRLFPGNICIFFSGGVDSMLLAIFMHYVANPSQKIYLINTAFSSSSDRTAGETGFKELCSRFKERTFVFVSNDIDLVEVRLAKEHIYRLIHPKTGPMDFNIGATLFFTARESRKYSRVAYLGSGADELFGGYSKYSRGFDFRNNMFFDLFTISSHNLCRDDRVVSDNQVECRFPFLDSEIILRSLGLESRMFVRSEQENKFIIRELLRRNGFESVSGTPKKAMQYGSGISKIESNI